MGKRRLKRMNEVYSREELELALEVLNDLEVVSGVRHNLPIAELNKIIKQSYPPTYTDAEMKSYLESLGYTIENERDLSELANDGGFTWSEEGYWF